MAPFATRREVLAAMVAVPLAGCVRAAGVGGTPAAASGPLVIYSPAPADNPLHALNTQLLALAEGDPLLAGMTVPPMALPQSINSVADADPAERHRHWPIVTTADFRPARMGAGPDWHGYDRANGDLKFVAKLYDVGFGIQPFDDAIRSPGDLRGKRIGVPPRPSAVRWLSEALLGDGWGILDDVTLVDIVPPQIAEARAAGQIDATSWNLIVPKPSGLEPVMGGCDARYLTVDDAALERINAASDFELALLPPHAGDVRPLSFAQALAAWDGSDPRRIEAMLARLADRGSRFTGFPASIAEMRDWPGLREEEIHPVARAFWETRRAGG
ncbi:ABC transporter substrate-binding protein [Parasphingopyxis sp.]|uniref:ABC transporter substrate-binding protein n=1 Tax=Parasphingopyxis sp. TaxID=1920299 RepID=UPI0032EC5D6A